MKVALGAVLAVATTSAYADSTDSAFSLCRIFDAMGLLSEKCQVSGRNVDISVDMKAAGALQLCAAIPAIAASEGKLSFDEGWQLRIFSPFTGTRTLAVCNLHR